MIGDEETVDDAAGEPGQHAHREGHVPGIVPGQEQAGHDGDERHDRAYRQVDAAGDQHHRHAERHDAERREVARDVAEVLHRAEGRLQPAVITSIRAASATATQNAWER